MPAHLITLDSVSTAQQRVKASRSDWRIEAVPLGLVPRQQASYLGNRVPASSWFSKEYLSIIWRAETIVAPPKIAGMGSLTKGCFGHQKGLLEPESARLGTRDEAVKVIEYLGTLPKVPTLEALCPVGLSGRLILPASLSIGQESIIPK